MMVDDALETLGKSKKVYASDRSSAPTPAYALPVKTVGN